MTSGLGKLNLRPQERRLVAVVLIVVFLVLNVWFVWPHFGDWSLFTRRLDGAQRTLDTREKEITHVQAYQVKLRELEEAGSSVVADEQELDLVRRVDRQAIANNLRVIQSDPRPHVTQNTQTNRFFEEQYETLHATSDTEELINFLVSLTATNSLIRVKDLTLKVADASGTKLDGMMTLVASYQRKTPAKVEPALAHVPGTSGPPVKAATPAPTHNLTVKTNKPGAAPLASVLTNRLPSTKMRMTNQPPKRQ